MTKSEYIEEWKKRCREEWFKDHKATFILNRPEVIIINWQKPETWNYGCRFIIHRRWLCVMGDIGEATYGVGQDMTLEFLGQLDFDYFYRKCCASEEGRRFDGWEGAFCVGELKEFLESDERPKEQVAEILESAETAGTSERDWTDFLYQPSHDYEIRDDDYSLADAGVVPHIRCIGHFVGLQMAIEQLKKAA